jgi:hypothetical protein
MCNCTSEVRIFDAPRNDDVCYLANTPGTDAERPTLPGGRGAAGARGGACGWRGALPRPKKSRSGEPD